MCIVKSIQILSQCRAPSSSFLLVFVVIGVFVLLFLLCFLFLLLLFVPCLSEATTGICLFRCLIEGLALQG